jgi:hypothetical protein
VSQSSDGVPNILHKRFDKADAAGLAALVFYLSKAAKLQPCATQSLRGAHPRIHMLGGLTLEVEAELVVELTLGGTRPEEGPQAEE